MAPRMKSFYNEQLLPRLMKDLARDLELDTDVAIKLLPTTNRPGTSLPHNSSAGAGASSSDGPVTDPVADERCREVEEIRHNDIPLFPFPNGLPVLSFPFTWHA